MSGRWRAVAGLIAASAALWGASGGDDLEARLAALEPSNPMAYFELAEEVADAARDEESLALAQRLFALAGALDAPRLGRSACLALADLETHPRVKERLVALAWLLDTRPGGFTGVRNGTDEADPAAALAVAEAIGNYRQGDGVRALAALRRPGAEEVLESCGHLFPGGAPRFTEDCRLYRGGRRPMLTDQDIVGLLRIERALLGGAERSWAGDLLLDRGRPLIEVDPDRLQETLGADPASACYRAGRWGRCD